MTNASPSRRWSAKFRDAIRGVRVGMSGQSSFRVHLTMVVLVTVAAVVLRVNLLEWCLLLLCIAVVLGTELFNSSIESMSRSVTSEYHDDVRDALDIASGAVLIVSVGAAIIGATIFIFRLGIMLGWWGSYLII